jgi:hypothetical protein
VDLVLHCRNCSPLQPSFPVRSFGMFVLLLHMVPTAFIFISFKLRYKQEVNIGHNKCTFDTRVYQNVSGLAL